MAVTSDGSEARCCKEQYCIGTWNVRSMNQGKLEVLKQEMARVIINILGIIELKWYDLNQIPYNYTVEVRNRFKGLDLTDRVAEELWMEICDTVQETRIKTIPKKKKCRKAKWLSQEALQIAEKEEK